MKKISKQELGLSIKDFKLPKYDDIPDVGLFLEQTVKYISKYLEPLENMSITSSMVSNYVKKKIISNPIKKQYYPEQIAYLIFIAISKSVLALEDIQILINIQKQSCDIKSAYEYFCNEFEKTLYDVFEISKNSKSPDNTEYTDEKLLLKNTVITIANKIYLDKCFYKLYNDK